MAVTTTNLIQGPATLYTGPFGTVEPATLSVTPGTGWTDVGGTMDGIELDINDTYTPLTVDQLILKPESRRTERELQIKTSLAEATLGNLAVAINNPAPVTATGTSTLTLQDGLSAFVPIYYALLIDGFAPGGFRRRIIIRKAIQTDSTSIAYKKDDQTVIPVTFDAHYVSSSINSMIIVDATA